LFPSIVPKKSGNPAGKSNRSSNERPDLSGRCFSAGILCTTSTLIAINTKRMGESVHCGLTSNEMKNLYQIERIIVLNIKTCILLTETFGYFQNTKKSLGVCTLWNIEIVKFRF
jgi:hypothetical protein